MLGQPHYCIIVLLCHMVVESLPSDVTVALHRFFVSSLDTGHEDIMIPSSYTVTVYSMGCCFVVKEMSPPQCTLPHTAPRCYDLMSKRVPQS